MTTPVLSMADFARLGSEQDKMCEFLVSSVFNTMDKGGDRDGTPSGHGQRAADSTDAAGAQRLE